MANSGSLSIEASYKQEPTTAIGLKPVTGQGITQGFSLSQQIQAGASAGQAAKSYSAELTVPDGDSINIDLYEFDGSLNPVGQTYTNTKLKLLILQNKTSTAGVILSVGDAASNTFTSIFGGTNPVIKIQPGACCIPVCDFSANGVTVSNTNKILKVANAGSVDATLFVFAVFA
jgi:hypothetical protein